MSTTNDPMRVMSDLKPQLLDDLAAQGYRHRRQADLATVAAEARSARFAEPGSGSQHGPRRDYSRRRHPAFGVRFWVPVGVTPRAAKLFRTAPREEHYPERPVAPRPWNPLARVRPGWRLGVTVSAAAALAAGIVVAVHPSAPVVLTAQLLANRASAAALAQPAVSPGQWVYRVVEWNTPDASKGTPTLSTQAVWETADGNLTYSATDVYSEGDAGSDFPSYSQLGSLPRDPAALDAYLERTGDAALAFSKIEGMLSNYVLPPALQAEVYQALALLPGIKVDSHATAIDGRAGVAFVMRSTLHSARLEIILNLSTYAFMARATESDHGRWLSETAVERTVIVGAPGSTQPSLTPPTAAELLAERAARAASYITTGLPLAAWVGPSDWLVRNLDTSSGNKTIWATADDLEQASYVNGKLQVCARSAPCAASTQWLMPAGPSYRLVHPVPEGKHMPPALPGSLPQLLAALNSYSTGCTDVAGDCNAVNVIANMDTGYLNSGLTHILSFLVLADIPGVTVQHVTDVAGHADVAFHFPFRDGVTEILLNASTYQVVGYVRGGTETVITKEVAVTAPGSLKPASPPW